MKKRLNFILVLLLVVGVKSYSQTQEIKGKVLAFKGFGVNNVSVYAKKSKMSTVTDTSGFFTIECNSKDVIIFKASGFYYQTLKIKGNTKVSINLVYLNQNRAYNEVIKNSHLSKTTLDYCIENLLGDNNNYDKMNSIYQIIQSENSGAKVVNVDGVDKIILNSRGANTLNSGGEALLVVNGMITQDISGIRPEQVKTVKVLLGNDAASWGSRGGNGVVEITLKSGT